MEQKTENYNLLIEDWIPVLWNDGRYSQVGIMEALRQAGRIRQIAASNPMDRVAILRFLLALLYWCKGNPPDEGDAFPKDSFPADWFLKLDENQDCFNLLGESKRFYQCLPSGSMGSLKKLSANYLVQEIPTGTNFWHFRHSIDGDDGLCLACCAMGLLRLPMFATSGGRGKPPGINAKPPFYVMPTGASLAETLRFSWRPVSNLGTPAWEKPDLQLPETDEVPLLTGLTWLTRRVWLNNPEGSTTVCISCGRKDHLVRFCAFDGIGSTKKGEDDPGRVWRDPHVLYPKTGKDESLHATDALGARDAAAGEWAKIMAEMLRDRGPIDSIREIIKKYGTSDIKAYASIVGFSTVQNDKYLEAKEYLLPLYVSSCELTKSLEQVERWLKERGTLEKQLIKGNKGKTRRSNIEIETAIVAICPHVEDRVSVKIEKLFSGEDSAWEQGGREYRTMMVIIAKSLSPGFTTASVLRRQQIACVTSAMRSRTEVNNDLSRNKGGTK